MENRRSISRFVFIFTTLALFLVVVQCGGTKKNHNLPDNIFGVKLEMSKTDAENRLREVGELKNEAEKRQQVWTLKNDARFDSLAIGYNKENHVRYITAFYEGKAKERMRFTDVGDVTKAKKEITEPHHRYTWEVPANYGKPAYIVTIYGTDKDYLTTYSLAQKPDLNKTEEDEK